MTQFHLAPNAAAVRKYYAELDKFDHLNLLAEGSIRHAFADLLRGCDAINALPELAKPPQPVIPPGTPQ